MFKTNKLCKFAHSCAYFHPEDSENNNKNAIGKLKKKIENLENTVKEKVVQLETTAKVMYKRVEILETKIVEMEGVLATSEKDISFTVKEFDEWEHFREHLQ